MNESNKAVFLSYASGDSAAALRICEALRAGGIEVWFDRSALRGGDTWDTSIREQIRHCALFMPVISATTQAREEGYFRLEWKLAVDRSHLMAHDRAFILPVVIDDTVAADSRVPEKFREVQWTSLPGGHTPPEVVARIAALLGSSATVAPAALPASAAASHPGPIAATPAAAAPSRPSRQRLALAALAGVVLLAGIGWVAASALRRPAAVVPYSIEDRRMTIAILPFDAPEQDPAGARIATDVAGTIYSELQGDVDWVQVVPRQLAEGAAKKHAANHALAQELNVHFLIRGTVSRVTDGYRVELQSIDGQSDRTLQSETVAVPTGPVTPRSQWDVSKALHRLFVASVSAEAERVRDRPVDALDVRDLTFRAFVDWRRTHQGPTAKGAYVGATELLNRALALAPDDPLALVMTARVNLCDCVNAWSKDPKVQQAIGAEATEKLLHKHPGSAEGLFLKEKIYVLQGRYEDALLTLEALPAVKDIGDTVGYLDEKCSLQLRLGKPQDALATCKQLAEITGDADQSDILAAIYFELGDYEKAARLARETVVQLNQATVGHPIFGAIALTLVAAEARLGHMARAKAAFEDFKVAVPAADSITAIRKWINPRADLAGYEPLYEGLKLAGVRD